MTVTNRIQEKGAATTRKRDPSLTPSHNDEPRKFTEDAHYTHPGLCLPFNFWLFAQKKDLTVRGGKKTGIALAFVQVRFS